MCRSTVVSGYDLDALLRRLYPASARRVRLEHVDIVAGICVDAARKRLAGPTTRLVSGSLWATADLDHRHADFWNRLLRLQYRAKHHQLFYRLHSDRPGFKPWRFRHTDGGYCQLVRPASRKGHRLVAIRLLDRRLMCAVGRAGVRVFRLARYGAVLWHRCASPGSAYGGTHSTPARRLRRSA